MGVAGGKKKSPRPLGRAEVVVLNVMAADAACVRDPARACVRALVSGDGVSALPMVWTCVES